ncbi:MAG: hypothetical protein OEV42_20110 [Deltaproteobacteria bacterium]|nr:hypothetical protein [Deltaproteobacteria bacterium]
MKRLQVSLVAFVAILFLSGTLSEVFSGSPTGTYCWDLLAPTGKPIGALELAVNDDAPPAQNHLSAVGIWQRIEDQACVPVHGTMQRDRLKKQMYEIALSYEDMVDSPYIQGHFHSRLDSFTMFATYIYQDENSSMMVKGQMKKAKCPIKCP